MIFPGLIRQSVVSQTGQGKSSKVMNTEHSSIRFNNAPQLQSFLDELDDDLIKTDEDQQWTFRGIYHSTILTRHSLSE